MQEVEGEEFLRDLWLVLSSKESELSRLSSTLSTHQLQFINNKLSDVSKGALRSQRLAHLAKKKPLNHNELLDLQFYLEQIGQIKIISASETLDETTLTDLSGFRSLYQLTIVRCKPSIFCNLITLAPHLQHLSVDRSISTLSELLGSKSGESERPWTSLKVLNAAHNYISSIDECVVGLAGLELLDLSHNLIQRVENLQFCYSLVHVNLGHNRIRSVQNTVETLGNLKVLILCNNGLESAHGLEKLLGLEQLDISDNQLMQTADIERLGLLPNLTALEIHGNPMTSVGKYRTQVYLYLMKDDVTVDGALPSQSEKAAMEARRSETPIVPYAGHSTISKIGTIETAKIAFNSAARALPSDTIDPTMVYNYPSPNPEDRKLLAVVAVTTPPLTLPIRPKTTPLSSSPSASTSIPLSSSPSGTVATTGGAGAPRKKPLQKHPKRRAIAEIIDPSRSPIESPVTAASMSKAPNLPLITAATVASTSTSSGASGNSTREDLGQILEWAEEERWLLNYNAYRRRLEEQEPQSASPGVINSAFLDSTSASSTVHGQGATPHGVGFSHQEGSPLDDHLQQRQQQEIGQHSASDPATAAPGSGSRRRFQEVRRQTLMMPSAFTAEMLSEIDASEIDASEGDSSTDAEFEQFVASTPALKLHASRGAGIGNQLTAKRMGVTIRPATTAVVSSGGTGGDVALSETDIDKPNHDQNNDSVTTSHVTESNATTAATSSKEDANLNLAKMPAPASTAVLSHTLHDARSASTQMGDPIPTDLNHIPAYEQDKVEDQKMDSKPYSSPRQTSFGFTSPPSTLATNASYVASPPTEDALATSPLKSSQIAPIPATSSERADDSVHSGSRSLRTASNANAIKLASEELKSADRGNIAVNQTTAAEQVSHQFHKDKEQQEEGNVQSTQKLAHQSAQLTTQDQPVPNTTTITTTTTAAITTTTTATSAATSSSDPTILSISSDDNSASHAVDIEKSPRKPKSSKYQFKPATDTLSTSPLESQFTPLLSSPAVSILGKNEFETTLSASESKSTKHVLATPPLAAPTTIASTESISSDEYLVSTPAQPGSEEWEDRIIIVNAKSLEEWDTQGSVVLRLEAKELVDVTVEPGHLVVLSYGNTNMRSFSPHTTCIYRMESDSDTQQICKLMKSILTSSSKKLKCVSCQSIFTMQKMIECPKCGSTSIITFESGQTGSSDTSSSNSSSSNVLSSMFGDSSSSSSSSSLASSTFSSASALPHVEDTMDASNISMNRKIYMRTIFMQDEASGTMEEMFAYFPCWLVQFNTSTQKEQRASIVLGENRLMIFIKRRPRKGSVLAFGKSGKEGVPSASEEDYKDEELLLSVPLRSLRRLVIGPFWQWFRVETTLNNDAFVIVTRSHSRTFRFLQQFKSQCGWAEISNKNKEFIQHVKDVIQTSLKDPKSANVNLQAELGDTEVDLYFLAYQRIKAGFNLLSAVRSTVVYGKDTTLVTRAFILTKHNILICEEDYAKWPSLTLPSWTAPKTPQFTLVHHFSYHDIVSISLSHPHEHANFVAITFEVNTAHGSTLQQQISFITQGEGEKQKFVSLVSQRYQEHFQIKLIPEQQL